jgi:hypothetical protein
LRALASPNFNVTIFFMKFSFNHRVFLGTLGLALGLSGCRDFLDVNVSPNTATQVPASLLLPNGILRPAVVTGNTLNVLGNLYAGNWAQSADFLFYVPEQTYNLTTTTYQSVWTELYAGSLPDLAVAESTARANGDKNTLAIVRIMQAYNYQLLVDCFGDIPYTEALQGVNNLTPKYDKDSYVYDQLIVILNEALANIDTSASATTPGSADIVFGTNAASVEMTKWRRFANSLKLRIYLRQCLTRPQVASAGIAAMQGADFLGAGSTSTTSENVAVNPGFLNSSGQTNPFVAAVGYTVTGAATSSNQATRANALGLDYLKATQDTLRLKRIYTPIGSRSNIARNYQGIQSGATPANQAGNQGALSRIGPGIITPFANAGYSQPLYLMTAAESFFLQAEAVQRGYLTGTAQTLYESGIKESFKLLGLTEANATAYYSQTATVNPVVSDPIAVGQQFNTKALAPNFTLASNKIEAIITQKWIANNGINGFEAWTEFRRTGYPSGNYISLNASAQTFPVRIPYPQNEANNPNTPVGVTIFTPKIFWQP